MTTGDDESFDERAYTDACLSTAWKQRTRKRRIRDGALVAVVLAAAIVPWLFKFDFTTILVWYVLVAVTLAYERTEQRLKTMQIRLARMHDLLHRIAGNRVSDEELMELVSEDGPVDPDPELWSRPTPRRRAGRER